MSDGFLFWLGKLLADAVWAIGFAVLFVVLVAILEWRSQRDLKRRKP